jgi:hypothetical protein
MLSSSGQKIKENVLPNCSFVSYFMMLSVTKLCDVEWQDHRQTVKLSLHLSEVAEEKNKKPQ